MKKIEMLHHIELKELFDSYGCSMNSLVNIQIGYDEKVYILLSASIPERIKGMFVNTEANSKYSAICLTVDWENGMITNHQLMEFGVHKMNFHYIQPIGENILLLGARCLYRKETGPEMNAVIVDTTGNVQAEFCLGDGIQDCIVTDEGNIITSYFDEGVFGNYGWEKPIGHCGLIIWSENGEIKWEANRMIDDCYGLNVDEKNHIWYYYYSDFEMVRTDMKDEIVYHPQNRGFNSFLISKDTRTLIHDGGYYKHSEFFAETINHHELSGLEKVDLVYNGEIMLNKMCSFRSAKMVVVDSKNRLYVKEIISLG